MIAQTIDKVTPIIESYGAWGVFFISALEEVIAFIPSTLTMMAAGFFLLPAEASFGEIAIKLLYLVMIPSALGITIGALFFYSIGYFGGKVAIVKWGGKLGVSWGTIEKIKTKFEGSYSDEAVIFFLRAFPLMSNVAISAVCGIIRYPLSKFLALAFLGNLVRAFIMGIWGWSIGSAYHDYIHSAESFSFYSTAAMVLVGILILFLAYRKHKKYRNQTS